MLFNLLGSKAMKCCCFKKVYNLCTLSIKPTPQCRQTVKENKELVGVKNKTSKKNKKLTDFSCSKF